VATKHGDKVYAKGDVHTQPIEGFFGIKRGISGNYHAVSAKRWLQGYVNEYLWRYNHRSTR
jgi:hypothetical protein